MTDEEKWKAVGRNDASYDGRFVYAVSSTGIFCRPSCASKLPLREHVRFFSSTAQAVKAGFRPCKRCRSDLPVYRPAAELAQCAKAVLAHSFTNKGALSALPAQLAGFLPCSGRKPA
ncbi:MAG: Ada metal-binding domain-containing protein [Sporolactobacillus sp.]